MLKGMRKRLCLVLVCVMLFTSVPGQAFAVEMECEESEAFGTEPVVAAPEADEYLLNDEERFNTDLLAEEDALDGNRFFYLEPCERIWFDGPLSENFEDDAVVIVLTRAASRDSRTFTAQDFTDVGAVYVRDIDWLSDEESVYAERLWEAERNLVLAERSFQDFSAETEQLRYELHRTYAEARAEGEANTLVNFDEYRRILLIRLNQNCKENVFYVIRQLEQREYIRAAEPNYIPRARHSR